MSDKSDENSSESEMDDLAALSALVRPSMPPTGADEEETDDGKLDLRALAASVPPPRAAADDDADLGSSEGKVDLSAAASTATASEPPADEAPPAKKKKAKPAAEAASAEKKKSKTKKAAAAAAPEREAPAVAARAPVAEPKSGGGGLWIGLAIGAAVAAGAAWFLMNQDTTDTGSEALAAAPSSVGTPADDTMATDVTPTEDPSAIAAADPGGAEETGDVQAIPAEGGDEAVETDTETESDTGESAQAAVAATERDRGRTRSTSRGATARTEAAPLETGASGGSTAAEPAQPERSGGGQRQATRDTASGGNQASGSGGGLDNVLDQALGGRPNREGTGTSGGGGSTRTQEAVAASPSASAGNLPASPSRRDIARTLGGLMPRIRQCAGDQVGMALATILVRNDGSVASVSVGGNPFGGTPQGACMEGAIRTAQFPPFTQSTFRVSYPFNIR